ncbi:calmodulin [Coemansia reversa NRRL 1564]|uniref:Calmodulin n=1 Tax=Coemansia reversa (strain ATCC 12441 / NRRL 1564) TaxID=763665 RepID=A0A2G5B8G0_COERN|nr:calmodulin [Coemansia reversa NRRL 1564]|eukprot:PIA15017.1 calmodulin [Coemansia reversa NRRL 1564]
MAQKQQLSETEKRRIEYKEAFELFDTDGSGAISHKEMGELMRKMGHNPTKQEIQDMINEVDADNNGEIDFEEFVAMMELQRVTTDAELREAFKVFDTDGDGTISIDELGQVMKSLGEELTPNELHAMFAEADKDGNYRIDFYEFKSMMTGK